MFHEDRKQSFLNTLNNDNVRRSAGITLSSCSTYEIQYEKDVCEFDSKELLILASNSLGVTTDSTVNAITYLKKYTAWCRDAGYQCSNAICNFDISLIDKLCDKLFYGPDDLQCEMDAVFENQFFDSVDMIYRSYLWLLFYGLTTDEICTIKKVDLDENAKCIHINNEVIKLDRNAFCTLRRAKTIKSFEILNYSDTRKTITIKNRPDSPLLLSCSSGNVSITTMKNMISRKCSASERSITPKYVALSGLFYRVSCNEKEKLRSHDIKELSNKKQDYDKWLNKFNDIGVKDGR